MSYKVRRRKPEIRLAAARQPAETVMRRAQADLSGRVAEEVRATVGVDTETGRAVIHSFETRFPAVEREPDR